MCIMSKKHNFFTMPNRSETIWYAFILVLKSKIDPDSLNNWLSDKKLCFGSFLLNAVKFYVNFSIFINPSDHDAYSLGY